MECDEGVEGVREDCCVHDAPGKNEQVCCYCGLVYASRRDSSRHGQYAPRTPKAKDTQPTIQQLAKALSEALGILDTVGCSPENFASRYETTRSWQRLLLAVKG